MRMTKFVKKGSIKAINNRYHFFFELVAIDHAIKNPKLMQTKAVVVAMKTLFKKMIR